MNQEENNTTTAEVIGLIPAAGTASRLAPLPCSKELYPLGFRSVDRDGSLRPKVASHYLLEKMKLASINKAFIILRDGKWDIPAYFGDGKIVDMHLSYIMMDLPFGVPYTLDQAYAFVKDAVIALGFPDIMFEPEDAYRTLLLKLSRTKADLVMGLFPAGNPRKTDMVELDNKGKIRNLHIKPASTQLKYTWQMAVWTPDFTRYMHEYLQQKRDIKNNLRCKELFVGDVIQSAIDADMNIDSVLFEAGICLDIGTPEDLNSLLQRIHREQ